MFGFGKKRILRKMNELSDMAMILVCRILYNEYIESMEPDDATLLAAGVSNYLFGEELQKIQLEKLSREQIESIGDAKIRDDLDVRELVVQSLRVKSAISTSEGGDTMGLDFLSLYGKEYPLSPTLKSYEELIVDKTHRLN